MPMQLTESFPNNYWTHNSGGEHFSKHFGDLTDVHNLRVERGLEPPNDSFLARCMFNDGLVVLRELEDNEKVGDIAGFALADRVTERNSLLLQDAYVKPEHRNKGLGSFLVSKLIMLGNQSHDPVKKMSVHKIPTYMQYLDSYYTLPGDHITIQAPEEPDTKFTDAIADFKNHIFGLKRSLLLDITGGQNECTVYRWGDPVLDLTELAEDRSQNIVLAATQLLNQQ